jgi:hypothetical protein
LAIVADSWVDDRQINRECHDGDADPQDQMRHVSPNALLLDHQYVTLRST